MFFSAEENEDYFEVVPGGNAGKKQTKETKDTHRGDKAT